jgi:hypothetical protein
MPANTPRKPTTPVTISAELGEAFGVLGSEEIAAYPTIAAGPPTMMRPAPTARKAGLPALTTTSLGSRKCTESEVTLPARARLTLYQPGCSERVQAVEHSRWFAAMPGPSTCRDAPSVAVRNVTGIGGDAGVGGRLALGSVACTRAAMSSGVKKKSKLPNHS